MFLQSGVYQTTSDTSHIFGTNYLITYVMSSHVKFNELQGLVFWENLPKYLFLDNAKNKMASNPMRV